MACGLALGKEEKRDMGSLYLRTVRMDLRELTLGDLENLTALDSDPEVMRYISDGAPTPKQIVRDEILPRLMRVLEKAGLLFDSEFVEDSFPGEDKRAVFYGLTRKEYQARTS